jgi:polyribonucleotide nucleotidyltransferase
MSKPTTLTARIGDRDLHIESGKYAKLADGAALVTMGETIILVTAVSATKVKEGQDFFPLTVEYKEKAAPAATSAAKAAPPKKKFSPAAWWIALSAPSFPKATSTTRRSSPSSSAPTA